MRFIFVHGYKASPESNFWPWLYDELRKQGHEIVNPQLPNPENPDPIEWVQTLLDASGALSQDDIIIGHSLGAPTALKFLEAAEAVSTPKGVLLISPVWHINNEKFTGHFLNELDFDVLMWRAKLFGVLHDRKDDVIPFDHGEKYAKVLHAKIYSTEGNGHFKDAEYPIMLDIVREMMEKDIPYEPGMSLENQYEGMD